MTTILTVRKGKQVVIVGDGQVSLEHTIVKGSAKKVRRMPEHPIIGGFAGSAADGIALFEKLQGKLREQAGNLTRAAVDLATDWRTDRVMRKLEAMLLVADADNTYLLSGSGDIIEPDDGVVAIGSGGNYALSAARALLRNTDMEAMEIAKRSMGIAAEICVYTNDQLTIESLP